MSREPLPAARPALPADHRKQNHPCNIYSPYDTVLRIFYRETFTVRCAPQQANTSSWAQIGDNAQCTHLSGLLGRSGRALWLWRRCRRPADYTTPDHVTLYIHSGSTRSRQRTRQLDRVQTNPVSCCSSSFISLLMFWICDVSPLTAVNAPRLFPHCLAAITERFFRCASSSASFNITCTVKVTPARGEGHSQFRMSLQFCLHKAAIKQRGAMPPQQIDAPMLSVAPR